MANKTVSLRSVAKHFESLPDPRHERNRKHLLVDVISIAVCGVFVGCDGPTTIAQWAMSPLLSNVYMRRFLVGWKTLGYQERLQARVINYADDLVICCRGTGLEALQAMRQMMCALRLTVNEARASSSFV